MASKVDSLQNKETYSLEELLEGIEYVEWEALQKRLSKIIKFMSIDKDYFKDERRRYSFYREEKDILQFLLREYNDPVINKKINNKAIGKNLEGQFKELHEFRNRINGEVQKVSYEPSRKIIQEMVNEICVNQIVLPLTQKVRKLMVLPVHNLMDIMRI